MARKPAHGGRRTDRHKHVAILCRFPTDVADQIRDEAAARGMYTADFVRRLVSEGLDRLIPADEWPASLTRK